MHKINNILILSVTSLFLISGCTIFPGQSAYTLRSKSAIKLPISTTSNESSDHQIAKVPILKIDPELIIDLKSKKQSNYKKAFINTIPQYQDYIVGPGDILSIIVWDHPELTIPAGEFRSAEASGTIIRADGTVFYPYIGLVHVAGLTVAEVRDTIVSKLSNYIENIQLDIRVAAFRSKKVYIVGEVSSPGILEITDIPMTVIEAVNQAGGFTLDADHANLTLTRNGTTSRIDLQALYEQGAVSQNVLLQSGDVVNVADRRENKVFVLGEVSSPGSYIMNKRRMTLAEALSDASDIVKLTSNPNQIYVMRGSNGNPMIFHLDAGTPDGLILAEQFYLTPRDIVYVDAVAVARVQRVFTNIFPIFNAINTASNISFPLFNGR